MVPVHESDLAENRWKDSEWSYYELWEKVELKLRKRKRWIVSFAILLFIALSAIPIVKERMPKWRGFATVRRLATVIDRMKLESSRTGHPLRLALVFDENGNSAELRYQIQELESCAQGEQGKEIHSGSLSRGSELHWMSSAHSEHLGLQSIVQSICYDPLTGSSVGQVIAVIPAKDLTEKRLDRISTLYLSENSADISFD